MVFLLENIIINKVEMIKSLLAKYLEEDNRINKSQKTILYSIAEKYIITNNVLLELYLAIFNKKDVTIDENIYIKYTEESNKFSLQFNDEIEEFEYELLREITAALVDITEDVLPLGTVVELKKEHMNKVCDMSKIEKVLVVITYRFINVEDKSYYTYGGVIYPVANFNKKEILRFSPSLIKNIIHRGYSDDQEDAYVYLMKRELILENKFLSSGFYIGDDCNEHRDKSKI